ncbi:MAG: 3-dehydroquinate synthase [Heliobacteriaceae bacterium]|jgi:3-dehydroquinate synthase|nr:3-dehydroquinate synthase [Heliobacteriaceae bacterium]
MQIDVEINSKETKYPLIIEHGSLSGLKEQILSHTRGSKVLAVISEKVNKLYGAALGFSKEEKFILKDGEKEKNFKNYQKILNASLERGLTRKDAIIAIGGGVAGDLAGFAAATYMRGIDLIQVPTTLLACVDSSVGGKTAINTGFGKNLVGSFYQPKAVLINVNFLKTLDDRQFKTGFGEIVKYALIEKSCPACTEYNLVNFLSEKIDKIRTYDPKTLARLIEICVGIKAAVVQADEKEGNLRRILNFGHTYGHAVEKESNYKYTHGEAVVAGILYAFELALKKGLIDKNYKFFAQDLIKKFNFREIPQFKLSRMLAHMKMDKKASSDKLTFILPTDYSTVEAVEIGHNELM